MYSPEHYQKYKKSIKEAKKRYYEKTKVLKGCWPKKNKTPITKEKALWHVAKYRAGKNGLDFSIEISDIVIPDVCPVLGLPIVVTNIKTQANSPSIDRINSGKGYTKDNIRIISWRANKIKSDAKIHEIEAILRYMKESS